MNKQLLAGALAGVFLLTGCSSLLDREYVHVTPHNAAPTAEGDPTTLRAESYQELVNAVLYFITTGAETGTIRLYLDSDDVESELEAACLEVVQEDPLGAYAVEFIKYSVNFVVTYYEADVQITYRRSREQIASIVSATGITAIRSELESALSSFSTQRALRISYFDGDDEFIQDLAHQAYYSIPSSALDLPDLSVSTYPDAGRQRIVEINLSYHLELQELERRKELLSQELQLLSRYLHASDMGDPLIQAAAQAVLSAGGYNPEGGSTAYHALLDGGADSEGLALAMAALCEMLDIPCQVVEGAENQQPHFWNVVRGEDGWRHLDLCHLSEQDEAFRMDQEMLQAGYAWDADAVPQCGPPSPQDSV